VRPLLIVFAFPHAAKGLRLPQAREALGVQELVSEPRLEGFGVPVLPGSAGFEVERAAAGTGEPGPDGLGDELSRLLK